MKITRLLDCGTPKCDASKILYDTSYPIFSKVFTISFNFNFASPANSPATFSPMITFGFISSATLRYSKNKSSIFSTILPSEYFLVLPQPS